MFQKVLQFQVIIVLYYIKSLQGKFYPFQPMHLQLLTKSTIFATMDVIVLHGAW